MTTEYDLERGNLLDICAKLDLSIGQTRRRLDLLEREARKPRQMQPVPYRVAQSAPVPASGPLILRFAGPDQGHMWNVRSITAGGATPTTSTAGRVDVFVTATDLRPFAGQGLAAFGLADWRDQSAALPNVAFYGEGELPLRFNEELYVVFSNATPAQLVTAAAQVLDFQEGPLEQTWDLS